VVGAALLLTSLVLHESAHALIARRAGVTVQDMTLWALGGVTRMGQAQTPRAAFAIAIAGPLTSLAVGGGATGLAAGVAVATGWPVPTAVLAWLGWANLLLGVFNLLPAAPLDGGRVLQSALWWGGKDRERAERVSARSGRVTGMLLVALGGIGFLRGWPGGLWLVLVGFFISTTAAAEMRRTTLEAALRGVTVEQAMSAPVVTGPDWFTVDRFLEQVVRDSHYAAVPLVDFDGHPSGIVPVRRLALVPAARRDEVRVRDVATPISACPVAAPGDELMSVLKRLGTAGPLRILVTDEGRLVGIVTTHDVTRLVRQHLGAR
jgi:Zn-dependent protease/predicted transcriptional regulator